MTVKEFYDEAGGGYEEMLAKFSSDTTITAFLKIFKRDKSFETLTQKLDEGDAEGAFHAAHTLKGVVLNLNLDGPKEPVFGVTEALRANDLEQGRALFPALKNAYETAAAALARLLP